jgi:hypothetical protein
MRMSTETKKPWRPGLNLLVLLPVAALGIVLGVTHLGAIAAMVAMLTTSVGLLGFLLLSPKLDARLHRKAAARAGFLFSAPATFDKRAGRVGFDKNRLHWRANWRQRSEMSLPWASVEEMRLEPLGGLIATCRVTLILRDGSDMRLTVTSSCQSIQDAAQWQRASPGG